MATKSELIGLRVTPTIKEQLELAAEQEGRTPQEIIRGLVAEWYNERVVRMAPCVQAEPEPEPQRCAG